MKILTVTKEGGTLMHMQPKYTGLVVNEADLANVPDDAAPGSMFHTAGYAQMWELGLDGTWVSVL